MITSAMQDSLRARVGNPPVAQVSQARLLELLNRSLEFIVDRYRFRKARKTCTFPTVDGQTNYTLPTTSIVVMGLQNISPNGVPLTQRDEAWFGLHRTDFYNVEDGTATTGVPLNYILERDWMRLLPVPDDVYTLRLYYRHSYAALVAAGDVPELPSTWHEGVIVKARAMYYEDQQDNQKYELYENLWTKWVETKPDEVAEELAADYAEGVYIPQLARGTDRRLPWTHSTP